MHLVCYGGVLYWCMWLMVTSPFSYSNSNFWWQTEEKDRKYKSSNMAGYSCEALRTNCSSEKYVIRQVIGSWSDSKAFEWNLNTAGQRQGGLGDFMPREHAAFRAEKRSAQASAHQLSQAQGRLFCLLTVFDCFVCHWESFGWDWGDVYMRKFAPARVSYRDDFLILYPVYMMTRSFHISLFEGTIHVNKIYVWFKIANITLRYPFQSTGRPISHRNVWSFHVYMISLRDFVPEWDSRPGTTTGVNSRRGDSRRHDVLWWYHVIM